MRLDFNQHGSWRKGPDFDELDLNLVMEDSAKLADMILAKLRIVGEIGEVLWYRDPGWDWRRSGTRERA